MKIKIRQLNHGERFCCSTAKAKELFADTDICLDFAQLGREYVTFGRTKDAYYLKNNIKGGVLMSLYMHQKYSEPILGFYVIPAKYDFPECLQKEIEEKYLHEFKRLYIEVRSIKQEDNTTRVMLLELHEGKLKLHEFKL